DLLDLAVADDIVTKAGSWFSYGETRVGQGRESAKGFLRENPELCKELRRKVLEARLGAVANGRAAAPAEAADGEE
ncbi:MAG: DNA recombination/repair protein RecA, partial [Phycisphaerales bacterium]